jgi:O-antigen/teichoic acid export membrane protein
VAADLLVRAGGLSAATLAGQGLQAVSFLLVARLFPQDQVGVFSVFLSYAAVFAVVSMLSYELALPNAAEEELPPLARLLLGLVLASAVLAWLGSALAGAGPAVGPLVAGLSCLRLGDLANIRSGRMRLIAAGRVGPHLLVCLALAGLYGLPPAGIDRAIWLYAGVLAGCGLVYAGVSLGPVLALPAGAGSLRRVLHRWRHNALWITPSEGLNSLAYNLPVVLIARHFGHDLAAQYGLVLRFGFGPINVFGVSLGNVYHSRLARSVREERPGAYGEYRSLRRYLLLAGVGVAAAIALLYPPAIRALLGPGWEQAADMAVALSPLFGMIVLAAPLAVSLYVFERSRYLFLTQLVYFLIALASFGLAIALDDLWLGIGAFVALSLLRYVDVLRRVALLSRRYLRD